MAPNIAYPADTAAGSVGPAIIPSGPEAYFSLWCATARPLREIFVNDRGDVTAGRSSRTCFIRGIKEGVSYVTSDSEAWRHRQIIFTAKGELPLGEEFEGDRTISSVTTSDGRETFFRGLASLPLVNRTPFIALLFKGNGNAGAGVQDWTDMLMAPVDKTRFKVLNDEIFDIRSGNDAATIRTRKRWTPINKNLVYGDEEIGNQMFSSYKSTTGKPGIGDVYIFDIFASITNTSGSQLLYSPTTTLYWHEK